MVAPSFDVASPCFEEDVELSDFVESFDDVSLVESPFSNGVLLLPSFVEVVFVLSVLVLMPFLRLFVVVFSSSPLGIKTRLSRTMTQL